MLFSPPAAIVLLVKYRGRSLFILKFLPKENQNGRCFF